MTKFHKDVRARPAAKLSLPPKSLVHLFQADGKGAVEKAALPRAEGKENIRAATHREQAKLPSVPRNQRHVHFDKECEILEFASLDDPRLWWQDDEFVELREDCSLQIDYFQSNRKSFLRKMTAMVQDCDDAAQRKVLPGRDECCLAGNAQCRGLERHLVPVWMEWCDDHSAVVLRRQGELSDHAAGSVKERWRQMREISRKSSAWARHLALLLARFDAHEAAQIHQPQSRASGKKASPFHKKSRRASAF
jgi:hypothetical protein